MGIELGFGRIFGMRAEGRNFDDVATEANVDQAETPPDDAAVFKQRTYFFRRCIGGDVEIFGFYSEQ